MNYDESGNAHNINVIVLVFNQPLPLPIKKTEKKKTPAKNSVIRVD